MMVTSTSFMVCLCEDGMTPRQVRAARSALGWSVRELADKAGISFNTVSRYENGADMLTRNRDAIERALREAGIRFAADEDREGVNWPAEKGLSD